MDAHWVREWPKCVLLLELALSYASTGRTQGGDKLMARLEEWRVRMAGAPTPVHTFLSELCYVAWLLGRGDHETARHHAHQAEQKARDIGRLLERLHFVEAREHASSLRRRSRQLQARVRELLARSEILLQRSREIQQTAPPQGWRQPPPFEGGAALNLPQPT
jgi:hypothetical protein